MIRKDKKFFKDGTVKTQIRVTEGYRPYPNSPQAAHGKELRLHRGSRRPGRLLERSERVQRQPEAETGP